MHGATSFGISLLLSGGLTRKVIVANLLAWPAAWFFMQNWLENFVYRTEPGIGEFLLAAIIAQIIALVTVSWHVYTTSLKNPADLPHLHLFCASDADHANSKRVKIPQNTIELIF